MGRRLRAFQTEDRQVLLPVDRHRWRSRYLIGCQSLLTTAVEPSKAVFTRLFKEYGRARTLHTDNGEASRRTRSVAFNAVCLVDRRLGIYPELIEPGKPQQNGRHERMHRTLKAEIDLRPGTIARNRIHDLIGQIEFNEERPHEALDMFTCRLLRIFCRNASSKIPCSNILTVSSSASSVPTVANGIPPMCLSQSRVPVEYIGLRATSTIAWCLERLFRDA